MATPVGELPGKLAQRVIKKAKPIALKADEVALAEPAVGTERVSNLGKFAHPPKKK